jgi:hypothetical protein
MEEIIALLGLTFVWAYLYSKSPESSTVSGFAFRLIFLGLTLWTAHLLVWTSYSTYRITEVTKYDNLGNIIGKEVYNVTLPEPIKQGLIAYQDVLTWVIYLIIALIIIFFIYNTFVAVLQREKE